MRSDAAEKGTDCAELFLTMQARPLTALAVPCLSCGLIWVLTVQACMSKHAPEFAAFGAELAANEAEHAAKQAAPATAAR